MHHFAMAQNVGRHLKMSVLTHLIELQGVQKLVQLAVLALLVQHDVVLHQTVQGELGLIVHIDLHGLQAPTHKNNACVNMLTWAGECLKYRHRFIAVLPTTQQCCTAEAASP